MVSSAKNEEAIGSISTHANGAVTIKSNQGKLSILNQEHVVVAAVSSGESVTIPSIVSKEKLMVAQVPPKQGKNDNDSGDGAVFWGLTASELGLIGLAIGGSAVMLGFSTTQGNPGTGIFVPICR